MYYYLCFIVLLILFNISQLHFNQIQALLKSIVGGQPSGLDTFELKHRSFKSRVYCLLYMWPQAIIKPHSKK